jgi:hypothetical protein
LEELREDTSEQLQTVIAEAENWLDDFQQKAKDEFGDLQDGLVDLLHGFNEFQTGVGYGYLTSNYMPEDAVLEQE